MLTYRLAAPEQFHEFFQLMVAESGDYLDPALSLMGADRARFAQLFRTVGQVYGIYQEDAWAGFYWVEVRDAVLHLHGLMLRPEFQGKGMGKQVLADLEAEYENRVEAMELGVHRSNERALALYERAGFRIVRIRCKSSTSFCQKEAGKRVVSRQGEIGPPPVSFFRKG